MIKRLAEVVFRYADSFGAAPYSDGDIQVLYNLMRTLPGLIATTPNIWDKVEDIIVPGFIGSDAGAEAGHVVNSATGKYDLIMWDWGDGTDVVFGEEPEDHTYEDGADDYDIRQVVIGPGGIKEITHTVTIAAAE